MIVSFLWAQHSISNSIRPWCLSLSWIPVWACHWISFSSGFSPFLSLLFFQTVTIMSQSFWLWDGHPNFPLDVLSLHWRRTLQVGSLPLNPEILSPPRSLVHSRRFSHLLPNKVFCFHSFCWSSVLQSCSPPPQYLIMFLSSCPCPLFHPSASFPLPVVIFEP